MKVKAPPKKSASNTNKVTFFHHNQKQSCSMKIYREMKFYQRMTELLIPKRPFQRLVLECLRKFSPEGRMQALAVEACQIAAETILVELFNDVQRAASHAKRKTITATDVQLVLAYKGEQLCL